MRPSLQSSLVIRTCFDRSWRDSAHTCLTYHKVSSVSILGHQRYAYVHHHKTIYLRILLLIEAAICQRHLAYMFWFVPSSGAKVWTDEHSSYLSEKGPFLKSASEIDV